MWHIDVRRIPLYLPEVSDESIVTGELDCLTHLRDALRPGEFIGPLEAVDNRGDVWDVPKALVVRVEDSISGDRRVQAKTAGAFSRRPAAGVAAT